MVHLERVGVTVWCESKESPRTFTTNVNNVDCLDCLRIALKGVSFEVLKLATQVKNAGNGKTESE